MSSLQVEGLKANYGPITALKDVSIEVPQKSIVALLGANGAGKSTTLKCISGVVKPAGGSIQWDGTAITGQTPNAVTRKGIAQVPEGRRIFKDLSVTDNLEMGAYTRSDRAQIEKDLDDIFDLFPRLKERHTQLGGSLSGGEQQMLAIGRGLMAAPRLLMLDEPSLGLAPIVVSQIFETLQRLVAERELTILLVEQNMKMALKVSSYGYVMQLGKVMISGSSNELEENKEVYETYLGIA
ncbi:ATP-binding cassette domain-containing protein [Anderseniella sp. Alg231-50]|uniref:ATP-binding cassette domain-containing protein n=1 Tax=Anderseniella sp. Alg231-50 TaxID=1922226 RepID=UPI000D54E7CC